MGTKTTGTLVGTFGGLFTIGATAAGFAIAAVYNPSEVVTAAVQFLSTNPFATVAMAVGTEAFFMVGGLAVGAVAECAKDPKKEAAAKVAKRAKQDQLAAAGGYAAAVAVDNGHIQEELPVVSDRRRGKNPCATACAAIGQKVSSVFQKVNCCKGGKKNGGVTLDDGVTEALIDSPAGTNPDAPSNVL